MATEHIGHTTEPVKLELDKRTLRKVADLAAAQECSVEKYLEGVISQLEKPPDPLLGLFRDEPELLDQIVEEAMTTRERQPLRQPHG